MPLWHNGNAPALRAGFRKDIPVRFRAAAFRDVIPTSNRARFDSLQFESGELNVSENS